MNLFERNLTLLKRYAPGLARRVEREPLPDSIQVERSRTGLPVPRCQSIYLHSSYDPVKEAEHQVQSRSPGAGNLVAVLGLGFGYHLDALLDGGKRDVWVVEPSLALFRLLIQYRELSDYLPHVRFVVGEPVPRVLGRFLPLGCEFMAHGPSLQIGKEYFAELERGRSLQEFLKSNSLRILVVNPIYGGSLPTARYCAQALEKMGHQVRSVECEEFADGFFSLKKATSNKEHGNILARRFMGLMDEMVIARAAEFRPDLILALAQAPLSPEGLARLKQLEAPIAFWFVEDHRSLPYWKEVAGSYDFFFTLQRGSFPGELTELGTRPYYLPQGCWPKVHRPLPLHEKDCRYQAGVSFMGAPYYNRIQSFTRLLDLDFKIWGEGWDMGSVFGPHVQDAGRRVTEAESAQIYNGGTVNLNLHSSTFHEGVNPSGDFVNPRTFEIAACLAFQLVDRRSEMADLFLEGEEIAVFGSIDELREKILHYLRNEDDRLILAQKGYERVLREHTLVHRMRELLLQVFLNWSGQWQERAAERERSGLEALIREAGAETELGRTLERYSGVEPFRLKTVIDDIKDGEGELSRNELLFLMLDQVVKEEP